MLSLSDKETGMCSQGLLSLPCKVLSYSGSINRYNRIHLNLKWADSAPHFKMFTITGPGYSTRV